MVVKLRQTRRNLFDDLDGVRSVNWVQIFDPCIEFSEHECHPKESILGLLADFILNLGQDTVIIPFPGL